MKVLIVALSLSIISVCNANSLEIFKLIPLSSLEVINKNEPKKDSIIFPNRIYTSLEGEISIGDIFKKNELTIVVNGYGGRVLSSISKIKKEEVTGKVGYTALIYYNIGYSTVEEGRQRFLESMQRNNYKIDYPVIFDGISRRKRDEVDKGLKITKNLYKEIFDSKQFQGMTCGNCYPTFLLVNNKSEIVYAQTGLTLEHIKTAVDKYFNSESK